MKYGIIIHGPEIIDSGWAGKIIQLLSARADVYAVAAGTMCKLAVLDSFLEDLIDIWSLSKPSEAITEIANECDCVFLLNHGKTIESGTVFGNIVADRVDVEVPLVQVERPGNSDGKVIHRGKDVNPDVYWLCRKLGMPLVYPEPAKQPSIRKNGHRTIRNISGILPEESIMVNGLVIGYANAGDVELIFEDGIITAIKGGQLKKHGVEKLASYIGKIDPETAWIKSGNLRRTPVLESMNRKRIDVHKRKSCRAVLINHEAERTFELARKADLVISVGDDTTAIAGSILKRLEIPLIGITDGDRDNVLAENEYCEGSMIIQVKSGFDDIVGEKIKDLFFSTSHPEFPSKSFLEEQILELAKSQIRHVIFHPLKYNY
ncbi:DUF2117 family protein [Methanohalophilus mahii]|uniref:DUF2117 domain-containing protein n=1 Tax=Methanohalophilus mahii (strain ATCC 35705 / DSM 5219 / SLP) TaxID=547558 RepID=D5EAP6_METMS|nr:DUF2117 domain-containing protein [Methanohalophilus mahii]ADE36247.1 conserved hypothetical protein [Methanohalophilus mahii DSM 5219]